MLRLVGQRGAQRDRRQHQRRFLALVHTLRHDQGCTVSLGTAVTNFPPQPLIYES